MSISKNSKVLVVVPSFGDHMGTRLEAFKELSENVRKFFPRWDIAVFTDNNIGYDFYCSQVNVVPLIDGSSRSYWRSSDYYKFNAFLTHTKGYHYMVVLDDDMRIVSKGFWDGLEIAERYHCCFPLSPRYYFQEDLLVGADVSGVMKQQFEEVPNHLNILNIGVAFFLVDSFLNREMIEMFIHYMQVCPGRGTILMTAAAWRTGVVPYVLPETWCLCAEQQKLLTRKGVAIEPIALHCGHKDIKALYEREYKNA